MTCHRLIRCDVDEVIDTVRRRHPHSRTDFARTRWWGADLASWRTQPAQPKQLVWRQHMAGSTRLDCNLEIEQGANGVLVHLSAAPASGTRLTSGRLARLAVEVWCRSELSALVRAAESTRVLVGRAVTVPRMTPASTSRFTA